MAHTVSLSVFTRSSRRVLELLDDGDVILTRRGAPPLRLSLADAPRTSSDDASTAAAPALSPVEPAEAAPAGPGESPAEAPVLPVAPSAPATSGAASLDEAAEDLLDRLALLGARARAGSVPHVLAQALPWFSWLPPAAGRQAAGQIVSALAAEQPRQELGSVLTRWEHTAQVFRR